MARFTSWHPAQLPVDTRPAELLYSKAADILKPAEQSVLQQIRGRCRRWRLCHGDAIPSNLLIDDHDLCTLIDFENTGWYLPGYDFAVLRCVLARQPAAITDVIDQFAAQHAGEAAYTVNLVAAAAREVRLHTFFPPDPTDVRVHIVAKALATARTRLKRHQREQPWS